MPYNTFIEAPDTDQNGTGGGSEGGRNEYTLPAYMDEAVPDPRLVVMKQILSKMPNNLSYKEG